MIKNSSLDHLLGPENDKIQLNTLYKAAAAVGKELHIEPGVRVAKSLGTVPGFQCITAKLHIDFIRLVAYYTTHEGSQTISPEKEISRWQHYRDEDMENP